MRNSSETKVHYKGKNVEEDFVVYVDSQQAVLDWKADKSTPLAQVVGLYKVFVTHKLVLPRPVYIPHLSSVGTSLLPQFHTCITTHICNVITHTILTFNLGKVHKVPSTKHQNFNWRMSSVKTWRKTISFSRSSSRVIFKALPYVLFPFSSCIPDGILMKFF